MKKKAKIIVGLSVVLLILIALLLILLNGSKKYTVEFDTNGGTTIESIKIKKGEALSSFEEPTREGYIFVGWYYNDELFDLNTKINDNIKLVAKWQEKRDDIETFVIKFDTQGGNTIANQIVEKGNKAAKPADPIREGYTFKGWYVDDKEFDFNDEITSDLTITAKWEKNPETSSQSANPSSSKPKPSSSSSSKPSSSSSSAQPSSSSSQVTTYTVTFDSNGGSNISSQTVESGKKATRPTNPTREGYTFNSWKLNGNEFDFSSAITSNITLVASWTQKTYTIRVSIIDEYSPDRVLTVYENGTQISVRAINYIDGTQLCSGSNMTVNKNDIAGETSFIVVLSGGTPVTATVS